MRSIVSSDNGLWPFGRQAIIWTSIIMNPLEKDQWDLNQNMKTLFQENAYPPPPQKKKKKKKKQKNKQTKTKKKPNFQTLANLCMPRYNNDIR